ncbi:helix-turn-helix transcriptional regulator [Paenibacillus sacheonensis]|uniref:Helix-turn-helix domain-containing protein n=1 Tax=Paenibacillus sacheonensis TaxID=742054 RepID=A0A7X4YWH7_9BACL|nr:helix-turn-helix transcriptional regulator [Paenibacillus sacheonensis]MBM7569103.1 AraC-like DNA-binding protein [Paenibacillus sacheonensis]NBC72719.1 helix-turn-helix domain-containing protein [Paenibacillus sacheonensis]
MNIANIDQQAAMRPGMPIFPSGADKMSPPYRPIHAPQLQPQLHRSSHRLQEYAPSRRLESHVTAYWIVDFLPVPGNPGHRVIPDGCVDIVVDLLASSSRRAAYVVGLTTQFEVLQFAEARSVCGIRLYSESAHSILNAPLSAFMTHRVFLEDIWGSEALDWVEKLQAAKTNPDIIETVEQRLCSILKDADAPAPTLVHQSMRYIYDYKGILSVTKLADKVNFSERHLRRAFERELGLSPKEMMGIVRFQSVLQELCRGDYPSLTDLALQYGYYDHSHFSSTFTRYYGLPLKHLTKLG